MATCTAVPRQASVTTSRSERRSTAVAATFSPLFSFILAARCAATQPVMHQLHRAGCPAGSTAGSSAPAGTDRLHGQWKECVRSNFVPYFSFSKLIFETQYSSFVRNCVAFAHVSSHLRLFDQFSVCRRATSKIFHIVCVRLDWCISVLRFS